MIKNVLSGFRNDYIPDFPGLGKHPVKLILKGAMLPRINLSDINSSQNLLDFGYFLLRLVLGGSRM